MAKFTDTAGRQWELSLADAYSILEIRKECDPKFLIGEPQELFKRLEEDPFLLCSVIFVLCKKQIDERKMKQEEFYLGVMGDGIEAASAALVEAILDFFPKRKREMLQAIASKTKEINEVAQQRAMERLNNPDLANNVLDLLDRKLDALGVVSTPPGPVSNTPDSSASPAGE